MTILGIRRRVLNMSPGGIVLIYFLFGGIWILLSDQIVALLTTANSSTTLLQSAKGGVFVFLSGTLIFGLLQYREKQLTRAERTQELKSQESQVLQRIFRHNIRNDLNVIKGYMDLVGEELADAESSDRLSKAQETATDLLRMSEKVRSIQRLDVDETVPEPTDVVQIVERVNNQVRDEHPAVAIDEEHPDVCIANAGPSLRYAIQELLNNSIEHYDGPRDGVRITTVVECADDIVYISVSDNGPGIPEEELAPLEENVETQLKHGSGVGLWVVRWICDKYDGEVSFDTMPHGGALVMIALNKIS